MAGRRPVAGTRPPVPTIRAVPAVLVVPVVRVVRVDPEALAATPVVLADRRLAITRADPVDPVVRVAPAVLVTTRAALAGLVAPVTIPVLPAVSVDRIRTRAARGTEMTTAATSTGHRGAMGRHPGVRASRRGRHGIDRFPRPVGAGTTARSTTGDTTKRRTGTPVSISGDLTSSECGSRCDR